MENKEMQKTEKKHSSKEKVPVKLDIIVTKNDELIMSLVGDEVIIKNGYKISVNSLT